MQMPEGWEILRKVDQYDFQFRTVEALNLMKEMAEALNAAVHRIEHGTFYTHDLSYLKEVQKKFKEWK